MKILWFTLVAFCCSCIKEVKIPLFEDLSYGCQSFSVYKLANNQEATVAVIADRNNLDLDSSWNSFQLLEIDSKDLEVVYTSHSKDTQRLYCNDVSNNQEVLEWETISGRVDIRIKEDSIYQGPIGNWYYTVDIFVENITFKNRNKRIYMDSISFLNVTVGSLPG